MYIFGIPDPDPHENLCGSETLKIRVRFFTVFRGFSWIRIRIPDPANF